MTRLHRQPPEGKSATSSLTAISWLGSDQRGAQVLTTARELLLVEHQTRKLLPPALAQACRVARIQGPQITLAVPSAAYAAKLRQLAPRIAQSLSASGWNLTEISVKVQASLLQIGANTAHTREVTPLDDQALDAFEELKHNLKPGSLADAVQRLLTRHRQA